MLDVVFSLSFDLDNHFVVYEQVGDIFADENALVPHSYIKLLLHR